MDKAEFWDTIETAKNESGGSINRQLKILHEKLCNLTVDEIVRYDTIFSEYFFQAYTWELWAAAYIINQGCGDDSFMDFRAGLISRGEDIFTKAVENPESLIEVITFENGELSDESDWAAGIEEMNYIASGAYEAKTGSDEMPSNLPPDINIKGKEWNEGEENKVLPKLAKHCRAGRTKTIKKKVIKPNPAQFNFNFDD